MIYEDGRIKILSSPKYHYFFNKFNGFFVRWGGDRRVDPEYSPFGPEIVDVEISTVCNNGCKHCYKSNTKNGKNMTILSFITLIKKFPETVTQIALGVGDLHANPDLSKILCACRLKGIIPNITINGFNLTHNDTKALSIYCGAIDVSLYDKKVSYDAVRDLTKLNKQVNLHVLLSAETFNDCKQSLRDYRKDKRLEKLNSVLFLWLKQKGRGESYHPVTMEQYKRLLEYAYKHNIPIGFDSCSAGHFTSESKKILGIKFKRIEPMVESCESTAFSYYINVDGHGFPCSFAEGQKGFKKGLDVLNCKDFVKDVWMNKKTIQFRGKLIKNKDCNGCRQCQIYKI